jgi:hypothetical protein
VHGGCFVLAATGAHHPHPLRLPAPLCSTVISLNCLCSTQGKASFVAIPGGGGGFKHAVLIADTWLETSDSLTCL